MIDGGIPFARRRLTVHHKVDEWRSRDSNIFVRVDQRKSVAQIASRA